MFELALAMLIIGFSLGWLISRKNLEFKKLKNKNKQEAMEHYYIALNLMIEQNLEGALVELKQVVDLDTDHIEAYLKLGDIYRKKGSYDKAIKIHEGITLRRIISEELLIKTYVSLLNDLIIAGRTDRIEGFVKKLMSMSSKDLSVNISIKNILKRLNMWEEVYEIQKSILKVQNSSDKKELAIIESNIGNLYLKRGDSKEALKRYKEAIDLDEMCLNAYIGLGDIYYEQRKVQKAIEEWRKVINLDITSIVKVYKKLEVAYFEEQEFEKMISLYEEILAKNPNIPEINLVLGEIYEKMGQTERAISLYQEAVKNKSDLGEAYKNLYLLYLKEGRFEEAKTIFHRIDKVFITKE